MEDENYRKLMDYAMRALSRRAHTVHEMGTKLKKRPQYTPALEQKVVMRLTELNLLNDDDFTRNLIENAVNSVFRVGAKSCTGFIKKVSHATKLMRFGVPWKLLSVMLQ